MRVDASSNICQHLHEIVAKLQPFTFPFDPDLLPESGIYLIFENGEYGHGLSRIVRIGTHTGPRSRLSDRLREHFVNENKDRSIFRKNIGKALLHRDNDPFAESWERDMTTRRARVAYSATVDSTRLAEIERRVTEHIQGDLSFVALECGKEDRRRIEANLIGTVSNCLDCRPSENWLGLSSPVRTIRESGMWQVQGIGRPSTPDWSVSVLDELAGESREAK